MLIKCCKKNDSLSAESFIYCAGLARSPFVLTEHMTSIYIYIYMVRETHYSSAVPGYVMWEELSVRHF